MAADPGTVLLNVWQEEKDMDGSLQGRSINLARSPTPVPALKPSCAILGESQAFFLKLGAGLGTAGLTSCHSQCFLVWHIRIEITPY